MCMHQISPTHILNKSNKMLLITRILHYQTGFTTKQTKSSPCQSCTPCVCQPGMAACKSCRMLSLFHQPGVQTHSSAKGCLCCQNFLCGTEKLSKFQMAKTLKSLPLTNLHFLFKLPFPRVPPLSDCVLITCSISRHKSDLYFSYVYMTVQSPDQSSMCFFSMTTLRQIPSVGWQKLQPVSHKSISGAMQVHEHGAGCIFNSTCFNPKRSGNRSMNALVVADGNVLDCPHCQARGPGPGGSADIIVSLWVLPGAPDTESCADSNPFLPERPSLLQSPLCHCICSRNQGSFQRKLLWACYSSDIFLPKEINCINSWGRRLNLMGMCHLGCGKTQAPKESLGIYHHSSTQIGVHKDTNLLL